MTSKVEQFLAHLDGVRKSGKGWEARCPAHHDSKASLSVAEGDSENVLAFCHAGCGIDSVLSALHLDKTAINGTPRVVAEYPYTRDGQVLYTARRWAPKRFDITPGLPPAAERVLFAEDWISYARKTGEPIYLVEGEKDALALHKQGVPATTAVCGAGSWHSHYADELAGLHVVLVADDDKAGHAFAAAARASLEPCVASLKVRKAKVGNDISDHLDAGFGLDELQPLAEDGDLLCYLGSDLEPQPVSWAWTGHIALGALTLIDGDPGDGKSVMTMDLTARWTTGAPMPDGSANPVPPSAVIVVAAEDDLNMTVSPRLRAAGADMSRVLCVEGSRDGSQFCLATDMPALERKVVAMGARIVILDPLQAFLGEATDSNNDASVRRALGPLSMMARKHNVALLAVRHLNKSGSAKAVYRGGGSIGFIGAARAAFLVAPHPDEDDKRVLIATKNNLGPKGGALAYSLAVDPIYNVVRVKWEGAMEASAQELLDGNNDGNSRKDITELLEHICSQGPMSWVQIGKHLAEAGFNAKTAEKYRGRVLAKHIGPGGNATTLWTLRGAPRPVFPPLPTPLRSPATPPDQRPLPLPSLLSNNNNIYIGGGRGASGQPDDQATEDPVVAEHAREFEVRQRPKVCEVCGQDGVRLLKPYYTVRCRSHHPDVYDHTGSDG